MKAVCAVGLASRRREEPPPRHPIVHTIGGTMLVDAINLHLRAMRYLDPLGGHSGAGGHPVFGCWCPG